MVIFHVSLMEGRCGSRPMGRETWQRRVIYFHGVKPHGTVLRSTVVCRRLSLDWVAYCFSIARYTNRCFLKWGYLKLSMSRGCSIVNHPAIGGSVGISRVTGCHYRCRTKVKGGKNTFWGNYPHVRNPPNGYHRVEVLGAHHGTLVH